MADLLAFASSGECGDQIDYPLEDPNEVEEAIQFATEALNAAQLLEETSLDFGKADSTTYKLLGVAVESYVQRFHIPAAALEDDSTDPGAPKEQSKLKKVLLYLYALVQRIFKAIFDFFANQKSVARKFIGLSQEFIGTADGVNADAASQLSVTDKSLMRALQADGQAPKNPAKGFEIIAGYLFKNVQSVSPVTEMVALLHAAKDKNAERVKKEAEALRAKLEAGLHNFMELEDAPESNPLFKEKKSPHCDYYKWDPAFGEMGMIGVVSKELALNSTFRFNCSIKRNDEIELRVESFPVLLPDEITSICRTARKACENILKYSREEALMQKALREAQFVTTKEIDENSVVALRGVIAAGQNAYIVFLRYVVAVMKALMQWCGASLKRYEGVKNG